MFAENVYDTKERNKTKDLKKKRESTFTNPRQNISVGILIRLSIRRSANRG
jgi:hypothetical protein